MKTYLSTLFFLLISLFNMNAMIKIYEAVPSEDSPYAGREIYLMPTLHHRKLGELSDNTINFLIEVNKADGHVIYEGGSGPGNEEWVEKLMEFGVEDQVAYAEFCQKPFIKEVIETYLDKYEDMTEEQIKVSPICLLFAKHYVAKDKIYQGEAFDVKLVDFFREREFWIYLSRLYKKT